MAQKRKTRRVPTKKVSRACIHCRAAHITCDEGRPCKRCIKKGLQNCVDAPRKVKKYLTDLPGDNNSSLDNPDIPLLINDISHSPLSPTTTTTTTTTTTATPAITNEITPIKNNQLNNPLLITNGYIKSNLENLSNKNINRNNSNTVSNPGSTHEDMNFLSSAADLEYAILGSIIDSDNLQHSQQLQLHHSLNGNNIIGSNNSNSNIKNNHNTNSNSNSNNNSKYVSPALSTTSDDLEYLNYQPLMARTASTPDSPFVKPLQPIEMNRNYNNTNLYSNEPECDELTNQYFIGGKSGRIFPEVVKQISKFKRDHPLKFKEQNRRSAISFCVGLIDDDQQQSLSSKSLTLNNSSGNNNNSENMNDLNKIETNDKNNENNETIGISNNNILDDNHRCGLLYYEPSEIYSKVNQPFAYVRPYHDLNLYLKSRFTKNDLVQMSKSIAEYRPSFIAGMIKLKEDDLIFAEQCFQRTLLEYDSYIGISGTPTLVWRRTSQIAYVGDEFCVLTGWNKDELLSKSTFAVEIMDDKSCVEYFKIFSKIAFGDNSGESITECVLLTPKGESIRTSSTWTMKRDVFGIPMMIIATFLPILT